MDYISRSNEIYLRNARMVQNPQISQHDTPHSQMKDKNHVVISKQKKHLTKFNTYLWQRSLDKAGLERMYLNVIKAIYDKRNWHHTQQWEAKNFSSKIRNNTCMPPLTTFIHHNTGISREVRQEKEINRIQNGKEEVKTLFKTWFYT